jgi:hypothetical protein
MKQALTASEVDPNMTLPHMVLGVAYSQTGQNVAAIESYERGIALGGMFALQKAFIGNVHGRSGDSAKAWKILDELKQLSRNTYVPFMASVFVFEGMGMNDLAIEALERAYIGRETTLVFLKTWPHFDHIRQDPRFQDVDRRVGRLVGGRVAALSTSHRSGCPILCVLRKGWVFQLHEVPPFSEEDAKGWPPTARPIQPKKRPG